MKTAKTDSAALAMIKMVWEHNREATGWSWQRLNSSMRDVVALAIKAGMRFDDGDFQHMAKHFSIGRWAGNNGHMCGEGFYREAVDVANTSACKSFEAWKGRLPFLIREPDTSSPRRIAVGTDFLWYGKRVECTSFSEDGKYLVAVTYKPYDTPDAQGLRLGSLIAVHGWDKYRKVVGISGDGLKLTLGRDVLVHSDFGHKRAIDKRLRISREDIREFHEALDLLADIRRADHATGTPNGPEASKARARISKWYASEFITKDCTAAKPDTLSLSDLRRVQKKMEAEGIIVESAKAAKSEKNRLKRLASKDEDKYKRLSRSGKLYKVLRGDQSWNGGSFIWSLPDVDHPGEWHEVEGKLQVCSWGFHLTRSPITYCSFQDFIEERYQLFEAEYEGEIIEEDGEDKVVVRRVRLVRQIVPAHLVKAGAR